jgi:hypothetical protein
MATAQQIKQRLRAHIEQRMNDFRALPQSKFYGDVAYGAVWAANHADAINDAERDKLLDELHNKAIQPAEAVHG